MKTHSVNPLYIIINETNGYIDESNRNKYLTLFSTDRDKDILNTYTDTWDKIKDLIRSITNGSGDYDEKYHKFLLIRPGWIWAKKRVDGPVFGGGDIRGSLYLGGKTLQFAIF